MEAKFKIGDKVKVIHFGSGVSSDDFNKIVTITKIGNYGSQIGYQVCPAIGNTRSKFCGGFIGESSFELAYPFVELKPEDFEWEIIFPRSPEIAILISVPVI